MYNSISGTVELTVCFHRNFFFYFIYYHLIFIYHNRSFPNRPLNPFFRAFLSTGKYVILYFLNRHARKNNRLIKLHLQASLYHIEPPPPPHQQKSLLLFKRERIQLTNPVDPEPIFVCFKMVRLAYQ